MLCFVEPENINNIYKKIQKKYNNSKYINFFNYFNRNWKPKSKYKKINIFPEWNYYHIIKSIDFDIKYLYLTNNISEHINKLLNSKLKSKYPTFINWKNAIFEIEKEVNNKTEIIERTNYISKLLLYYIDWSSKNKNNISLLTKNDIKKINSILFEGANIGGLIPISKFFNINIDKNENEIKNNNIINEDNNNIFYSDEDSEDHNSDSEDSDDGGEENIEKNDDNINYEIFDNLSEDKDLCYNLQKFVNIYNLDEIKSELNK